MVALKLIQVILLQGLSSISNKQFIHGNNSPRSEVTSPGTSDSTDIIINEGVPLSIRYE